MLESLVVFYSHQKTNNTALGGVIGLEKAGWVGF